MEKPTFDEITNGLVLEYPTGPILRSYETLNAFEVLELSKGLKSFHSDPYDLLEFFALVLPVNKKSRKKMLRLNANGFATIINDWLKQNNIIVKRIEEDG